MNHPRDFDLFITASSEAYTVQARAAHVGELPAQLLTLPFDLTRLPDKRRDVAEWIRYARETRLRGPQELRDARTFGKTLFDALFPGELLAAFRTSRGSLVPDERLRLRLRLPPTLVMLPWELLYDEYYDQFLALAHDLTLVRYPEMPAARKLPGPLQVDGPLRVVAVLASPQSEYYPEIRLDRELGRMEHALQFLRDRGQMHLDVIRGPGTLDQLRDRLRRPTHILHILSHGDLNRDTGEGELLFEDTDGAEEPINAELLRRYLERQHGQVQLVTLNACLGAVPVGDDPFSSVGLALIRSGVPAVVAMQFEVTEDVAAELTRVLYAELAAGTPVDRALSEARLHIFGRYRTRLDWAIPVLFSRAEKGVLFEFATPSPNLTEQVKRRDMPSSVQHQNQQTMDNEASNQGAQGVFYGPVTFNQGKETILPPNLTEQVKQEVVPATTQTTAQPTPPQLAPRKRIPWLPMIGAVVVVLLLMLWGINGSMPQISQEGRSARIAEHEQMSDLEQATLQALAIEETVVANQAILETQISATAEVAQLATVTAVEEPTPTIVFEAEDNLLQEVSTWSPFFIDTFGSSRDVWFTGSYSNPRVDGAIRISDGAHNWQYTALQDTTWWLRPTTTAVGDFYLTAEMQRVIGPTDSNYGLIFRLQENGGFRYYRFMITDQHKYEIALVDEETTTLIDWTSSSAIQPNGGNRLSVVGRGDTFTFYINDQYITEVANARLSTGQVGIIAGLNSGDEAEFRTLSFEVRIP